MKKRVTKTAPKKKPASSRKPKAPITVTGEPPKVSTMTMTVGDKSASIDVAQGEAPSSVAERLAAAWNGKEQVDQPGEVES